MAGAAFDPIAMAAMASTSPESPESFEVDDESSNPMQSAHWQMHGQTSPNSTSQQRASAPVQKRRRVTRACDECRRKKIKCDGKQPCTHCTVYSYDCTYDQPSNRRRNPAPQYIEALETRLQRAETLLRSLLPNIDLNDPNIEAAVQQRQAGSAKEFLLGGPGGRTSDMAAEEDAQLSSMIESTGQLDLDDSGHWDFHGGSSGTVFVKRMREQFGGLLPQASSGPFLPKLPRPYPAALMDSPRSSSNSPADGNLPNTADLPSKETAKILCDHALNTACSLLRFVHQPTFYVMFERIYETPVESFGNEEHQYLPLLYVVLALGCMFDRTSENDDQTYRVGIDHGLKYFRAARAMMDVTDCRDIVSLQTIIFMVIFLQTTANLSTCYSFIGIAMSSALRMGLHRNLAGNFNPIEREIRRRLFWIIRKMDTYVSALLGFPMLLSNDDIDQELPLEIDDEYITKDGILPMPQGKVSLYMAPNAHTRLMAILAKVIKYIYPTKALEQSVQGNSTCASYAISNGKIREIEKDLADWLDKLPMALKPGGTESPEMLRVQQHLRLAYAHVQMMLYRPFLHYVSRKGKIDDRHYACAAACVSVARNIVHITTEMSKRGFLMGAYWFTMYTTFFAILSLVFFVLENPDKQGSKEILADANRGKDALDGLAKKSQAADRCSIALRGLFEQLPQRLKNEHSSTILSKKKRSAPSPNPGSHGGAFGSEDRHHSQPGPNAPASRSTTFPASTSSQNSSPQRSSHDGNRFQINTISNPNLRQSYHEIISPVDFSNTGTPDSSSTGNSMPPSYPGQQQFGTINSLTDLNSMMFPSADPFAYPPSQPMMEFDNIKQENMGMANGDQAPYLSNAGGAGPGAYSDLEGQLFGPIPPYLTQGQQNFDFQGQMDAGGMMPPPDMNYHTGLTPNGGGMNFVLSGDNVDWGNILADQRYRQ
ncbi:Activator of stress genes 1-like protein [Lachnellula suecica]|uniref:Activator of stress genes 1-like protein n=1 Tax=Lachnellula suecica TaxID=602035 RepID=A0A8T9C9X8_9HELO|nr:Activator of stress genes 1-like protein [Lachnellula suecica]